MDQLINGGLHVNRIPYRDLIGYQIQATDQIYQIVRLLLADLPLVVKKQVIPQIMNLFLCVDLHQNAASVGLVVEVVGDGGGPFTRSDLTVNNKCSRYSQDGRPMTTGYA